MSKCNISIEIGKHKEELLAKAKKAITKAGGQFEVGHSAGSFSIPTGIGKIAGEYTLEGTLFKLHVTHKPLLVSCSRIETELRKYMHIDPSAA
jgi:hypothetical protein